MITPAKMKINPTAVRYIKLGESGSWEKECLEKGIIRIGFGSTQSQRFEMCRSGRWNDLAKSFIAKGDSKGSATRFTNELRLFFEDDGSILWITFMGERLCWGMMGRAKAQRHTDGKGVWRSIIDGWRSTDLKKEPLSKDRLSGALTKLAAFRGTSCAVDASDYVIRRINGQKTPEVERALVVSKEMKNTTIALMKLLGPRDFELLDDLVFTASGWRRMGTVGKTQKTLDIDLILPSTNERAFVQVKSKTTSAELAEYVAKIKDGRYDRMFYIFIFHSSKAATDDPRVIVLGPEQLADMVMDAGLVSWLIR